MNNSLNQKIFTPLATILEGEQEQVWVALDQCLAAINRAIHLMLNEVLHHPRFKEMEGMWMGLAYVLKESDLTPNIKVEILNATKQDLLEDFEEFLDLSDSGLFQHLYKSEYDQAGGEPFGCLLLNFELNKSKADITLLKLISQVAASCHCPTVGNASPAIFDLPDFSKMEEIEDFDLLFNRVEFTAWKSLRYFIDTRYLSLILPRFLARVPYAPSDSKTIFFEESCTKHQDFTWTHATYAFAALLIRSFFKHGWCIHIRGPKTGGMVQNIPPAAIHMRGLEEIRPPLELCFSDRQEHQLSDQGFIVINYFKSNQGICVFSAPTLYIDRNKDLMGSQKFSGSLPYLFLVSRLAHYQKVIQREHVGIISDEKKMEKELSTWLKSLVTQMPNPDRKLRARYPLRNASVKVTEDPSNPGFFSVSMVLKPHMQLEGVNAELTLISKLPRDKE